MFGIIISNENRGEYRYFIENEDDISKNGLRSWLYNTFCISNALANVKASKTVFYWSMFRPGRNTYRPSLMR